MRFILLALAMIGVVFYISNPQAFGAKRSFELSGGGRLERNMTGGANVDFTQIGAYGEKIFNRLVGGEAESASFEPNIAGSAAQESIEAPIETASIEPIAPAIAIAVPPDASILSAIQSPDLATYEGQLTAIAQAMRVNPKTATEYMLAGTKMCLGAQSSPILANYLVGLVQLISETSQLSPELQVANFKSKSIPLTSLLKAWLVSLPEGERTQITQELQNWAGQPHDLVACHMGWLVTLP